MKSRIENLEKAIATTQQHLAEQQAGLAKIQQEYEASLRAPRELTLYRNKGEEHWSSRELFNPIETMQVREIKNDTD